QTGWHRRWKGRATGRSARMRPAVPAWETGCRPFRWPAFAHWYLKTSTLWVILKGARPCWMIHWSALNSVWRRFLCAPTARRGWRAVTAAACTGTRTGRTGWNLSASAVILRSAADTWRAFVSCLKHRRPRTEVEYEQTQNCDTKIRAGHLAG